MADQNFSQQVFFENSLSPGSYFYSEGYISPPSTLKVVDGKVPVEASTFISAPNALELQWKSITKGGWNAELQLYEWRKRNVNFTGDSLFLWLCAKNALQAEDLPKIALRGPDRDYTAQLSLGDYAHKLEAGRWTRVRIPLRHFRSTSMRTFNPHRLAAIVFSQSEGDNQSHTMYIDDVRIEDGKPRKQHTPATPRVVEVKGYEEHVDVTWKAPQDSTIAQFVIYRSMHGEPFHAVGVQRSRVNRFSDNLGDSHAAVSYKVSARTSSLNESPLSSAVAARTHPMSDEELLSMVQEASFRYYWEANALNSGMARESTPGDDDLIAVGASGFGIMSLLVGVERGFITREQGVDRLLRITSFLARADRYHGAWPHFLSDRTAHIVVEFLIYDDGADLVETSFLMQGLLAARQYFQADTQKEGLLRDRITTLWKGVDWDWFRATPNRDALYWHWSPHFAFHIPLRLEGWNEVMITYLLAIASPTHASPPGIYRTGYNAEGNPDHPYGVPKNYYGITVNMDYTPHSPGPLFFTDYSYMGYDPRG